ncbi:MAG TPA: hypothetical protein V6D28_10110 [Leptolyngbyaceae cyanobacterium]
MNKLFQFSTIFGILSTVIVVTSARSQNQPAPSLPRTPANTIFNVRRQQGNCPRTVRLWTSFRYYEGGGEHTVIADTGAIAGTARLISSNKKVAEYRAPLNRTYASCVGQANSNTDDFPYRFRFGSGNVTFRVQLPADTPSNPSEISYKGVVSTRPVVRWAIAD